MRARIAAIKTDLALGLSPMRWARKHPWLAIVASTAGGFAAAATLIPSKEQQTLARLRRMHEALHPVPETPDKDKNSKKTEATEGAIGGLLLRQAIGLIRPVIVSLLSGVITGRTKPPEPVPPTSAPLAADNSEPVLPI